MAKRISKKNAIASFVQTPQGQALLCQENDKIEFEYALRAYIDYMGWYVGAYGKETSENDIEGSANYTAKIAEDFGYIFADDYEEDDEYYEEDGEYEDDEDYDEGTDDYEGEDDYDEDDDYEEDDYEEDDYVEPYEAPRGYSAARPQTNSYFTPAHTGGSQAVVNPDPYISPADQAVQGLKSKTADEVRQEIARQRYGPEEYFGSSQAAANSEPYLSPADRAVQGLKSKTADEVRQEIARQRYGLEEYYGGGESSILEERYDDSDLNGDWTGYDDENQFDDSNYRASRGMLPIFIILLAVFVIWNLIFHR